MSTSVIAEIAIRFSALSLVAIGGINAILPEIHRVVVDVEGWMTSAEFAELFALAQLAPGPNAMIVALIGWKVAGVAGAVVATLAVCGPSSVACYVAWQWADRLQQSKLRVVIQRALAPVAIGLIMASGYTIARAADHTPGAVALTSYEPAGTLTMRKLPLSSEVAVRTAPVSRLFAETFALPITAPC